MCLIFFFFFFGTNVPFFLFSLFPLFRFLFEHICWTQTCLLQRSHSLLLINCVCLNTIICFAPPQEGMRLHLCFTVRCSALSQQVILQDHYTDLQQFQTLQRGQRPARKRKGNMFCHCTMLQLHSPLLTFFFLKCTASSL